MLSVFHYNYYLYVSDALKNKLKLKRKHPSAYHLKYTLQETVRACHRATEESRATARI